METIKPNGKFVILKHIDSNGEHFDLILEGDLLCPTFKSFTLNFKQFERINDHRMIYLDYEGPIGKDRGSVVRVMTGFFTSNGQTIDLNNGVTIKYSFLGK